MTKKTRIVLFFQRKIKVSIKNGNIKTFYIQSIKNLTLQLHLKYIYILRKLQDNNIKAKKNSHYSTSYQRMRNVHKGRRLNVKIDALNLPRRYFIKGKLLSRCL